MSQFVYVMEDRNSQLLKIGISIDPEFRVEQINKDFGCDAFVAGVLRVDDARKTERFLHGMLAAHRVVGEWFEIPERQKSYLLAYFSDKPTSNEANKRAAQTIVKVRPQATLRANAGGRKDTGTAQTSTGVFVPKYLKKYGIERHREAVGLAIGAACQRGRAAARCLADVPDSLIEELVASGYSVSTRLNRDANKSRIMVIMWGPRRGSPQPWALAERTTVALMGRE